MCGIVGKFNFKTNPQIVSEKTIGEMLSVIKHRGPDGSKTWLSNSNNIGLGHNRLSIIDLSDNASQPMLSDSGRYVMVFNGEIYNYLELKETLIKSGHQFKTSSDSEVLLKLFELKKENCLAELEGMFAFAIWDNEEQVLFCARDRFGEKPFYYHHNKNEFLFGSEIKTLLKAGVENELSMRRVFKYLALNVIDDPDDTSGTFFEHIKQLEPAHCVWIKASGEVKQLKYWDINIGQQVLISENDAKNKFMELLKQSVKRRLRSDVAVGSSLSGGLDSSSIVYLINEFKQKEQKQLTFSARFKDFDKDEGVHIENVLKTIDADSKNIWVTENDFINDLNNVFYHQEQPFQSSSIVAQWKVMELAKQNNTTVLLDGQGADEILAGYHYYFNSFLFETYKQSAKKYKKEVQAFNSAHKKKYVLSLSLKLKAKLNWIFKSNNKSGNNVVLNDLNQIVTQDFLKYASFNKSVFHKSLSQNLKYSIYQSGLQQLLRYADRNSMAHSIEVRLPYLDYNLVEFLFSLPPDYKIHNGWTKYIQRLAFNEKLPNSITWRKDKIGYVAPQADWLKNNFVDSLYTEARETLIQSNILNTDKHLDVWRTIMVHKLILFSKQFN